MRTFNPAHQRIDLGYQHHQAERLGNVVICPRIISIYNIDLLIQRRKEDQVYIADLAHALSKFQPIPIFHGNIADDQVYLIFPEHLLRLRHSGGA